MYAQHEPNGSRLAFDSGMVPDDDHVMHDLWAMKADGSEIAAVPLERDATAAAWRPAP